MMPSGNMATSDSQSTKERTRHCPSQAEKSCGGVDEHPRAPMLQNRPEEQANLSKATTGIGVAGTTRANGVHRNSHSQHCPPQAEKSCGGEAEHPRSPRLQNMSEESDLPAATISSGVTEPAEYNGAIPGNSDSREGSKEERRRETEAEKEMKSSSKFSYFSTGISVAGIISIFSGYLGDQTRHAHEVPLKVCTMFMLTTFVSGASMMFLIFLRGSIRISIRFFRSLKYTTFGFLTLSMFSVSILFLKMFSILAFIPTLFVVMISFIMVRRPCYHHQGQRGMSYGRLPLPV